PDWADHDGVRAIRDEVCLIGCLPTPTNALDLADTDPLLDGAWCWDLAGEPADLYVFRWVSARSAADPTQPVNPGSCGDWKKIDLTVQCDMLADPYCLKTNDLLVPHV